MIDGRRNRYVDEPAHLLSMRENEPLHIPTADEYFAATGRILFAEDVNQYLQNTPFNLQDAPPPAVIGTFTWSAFEPDGLLNADLTAYFQSVQIKNELPYTAWRVRGLYYAGWLNAFKTVPEPVNPQLTPFGVTGTGWTPVSGHYALGLSGGQNLINAYGGGVYFMGGPPGSPVSLYFPIRFQIEVGYGTQANAIATMTRLTGGTDWPAWSSSILSDYKAYRAFSPAYACFSGYANIPGLTGCPNTGAGGYVPPDDPD